MLIHIQKIVKYSRGKKFAGLIFGRPELISAFEKSKNIGQDGTFRSCPSPFYQIYIVMFKKGGTSYQPSFAF